MNGLDHVSSTGPKNTNNARDLCPLFQVIGKELKTTLTKNKKTHFLTTNASGAFRLICIEFLGILRGHFSFTHRI